MKSHFTIKKHIATYDWAKLDWRLDYTRPVRYFRSTQVSLLLLFIGNRTIRGKDNKSLCSTVVKL